MHEADEQGLIAQAVAGDQLSLRRLLLLHHDAVCAKVERNLPADLRVVLAPSDICQEAYICALRELPTFEWRGPGRFRKWLLAIAERKLVDAVRRARCEKRGGGWRQASDAGGTDDSRIVSLLDLVAGQERSPSKSACGHEVIAAVQAALDSLPPSYRAAIELRHIKGLSFRDAAAAMGRSEHAVLMLCNRGMKKLGEAIGDPARFFTHV